VFYRGCGDIGAESKTEIQHRRQGSANTQSKSPLAIAEPGLISRFLGASARSRRLPATPTAPPAERYSHTQQHVMPGALVQALRLQQKQRNEAAQRGAHAHDNGNADGHAMESMATPHRTFGDAPTDTERMVSNNLCAGTERYTSIDRARNDGGDPGNDEQGDQAVDCHEFSQLQRLRYLKGRGEAAAINPPRRTTSAQAKLQWSS